MSGNITVKKLLDPASIILKDKPKAQAPAAPAAESVAAEKAKTEQMALRQSEASRALSAGGISESENEADTLGSTTRRRNASRALLGG